MSVPRSDPSDILAVDDPEVAATIRLIRQQSDAPIRVSDILREVPISRRVLERKFRKALNRGVFEEIRRIHLERAKGLLAGTHLSISDVAERAGFSNARHLSVVFRQELGLTPTDFRLQFRGRASGVVIPGHPKSTSRIR